MDYSVFKGFTKHVGTLLLLVFGFLTLVGLAVCLLAGNATLLFAMLLWDSVMAITFGYLIFLNKTEKDSS